MKYVAPLTDVEIQTLQEMHRYHSSRRARMRAHSLLLSHQGIAMPQIACIYQVDYRSVSSWIDQWQTRGVVGLYDRPGAGRRPILSLDEQHKVQQYLQDSPKDLKKVVHQLAQETGKRVSTKTIKRLIKKNGSVPISGTFPFWTHKSLCFEPYPAAKIGLYPLQGHHRI